MQDDFFWACIRRIHSLLAELEVPHHFTGGIASAYYGEPRFTQDIDIVVRLSATDPKTSELLERLAHGYFIHRQKIREAIRQSSIFQALEEETAIKIDFHVGEKIPGELQRSRQEEVDPGLTIPLVAKEDAILAKLIWTKLGSGKSMRDAIQMLKDPENLAIGQLRLQALKLGLASELSQVEEAAASGKNAEDLDLDP
jgi:Nucleotidyl transferase AbiEii toxin, Type IV TA system